MSGFLGSCCTLGKACFAALADIVTQHFSGMPQAGFGPVGIEKAFFPFHLERVDRHSGRWQELLRGSRSDHRIALTSSGGHGKASRIPWTSLTAKLAECQGPA
jgi:hypothetical protein